MADNTKKLRAMTVTQQLDAIATVKKLQRVVAEANAIHPGCCKATVCIEGSGLGYRTVANTIKIMREAWPCVGCHGSGGQGANGTSWECSECKGTGVNGWREA